MSFYEGVEICFGLGFQVLGLTQVDFRQNLEVRLVLEQRLQTLEKVHLSLERVPAGFRDIHEEGDTSLEMCQSCDGLHFDCVSRLQVMVQNSGRVDNLPLDVRVVCVTHVESLGRKRVRLDVDVSVGDVVYEGGLSDIWEPGDE